MIKKVYAKSRYEVNDWIKRLIRPFDSWALISINSDGNSLIKTETIPSLMMMNCKKYISLTFGDLTKKIRGSKLKLFTRDQALQIIKFINEVNFLDIDTLIVHCDAGVSRSGAISLFSCRYLHLDENEFRENNKNIFPNEFVLQLLSEVSGIRYEYESFWEKEIIINTNIF